MFFKVLRIRTFQRRPIATKGKLQGWGRSDRYLPKGQAVLSENIVVVGAGIDMTRHAKGGLPHLV